MRKRGRIFACLLSLLVAGGCSNSPSDDEGGRAPGTSDEVNPSAYRTPPRLDDGWRPGTPEDVGLKSAPLERMTDALRDDEYPNVHAVLIAKNGRLVYEEYFEGTDRRYRGVRRETVTLVFDRETLHDVRSVGKSFTAALVGIALASDTIQSVDRPLIDFFPEHADLATPEKRRITLRHALTMSAGLDWNEGDVPYTNPANHEEVMSTSEDPVGFVLGRTPIAEPGSRWYYNGGLPMLLGLAVGRTTERPFGTFARERLFEPLGITEVEWAGPEAWTALPELRWESGERWARVANPAGSLWIRPRDLLKFGSLYANGGRWNGRQVLTKEWVRESLEPHVVRSDAVREHGEGATSRGAYGFLWWHDRYTLPYGELTVHAAYGNGGQRIWVVPDLGLTAVHLTGNYNIWTSSWNAERLLLERIVPWALGIEATYRHELGRPALAVEPGDWSFVELPPTERALYVGEYEDGGERIEVREVQDALEMTLPGTGTMHMIPEGDHAFAVGRIEDGQVRKVYWPSERAVFVLDDAGDVVRYEWRTEGETEPVGVGTRVR